MLIGGAPVRESAKGYKQPEETEIWWTRRERQLRQIAIDVLPSYAGDSVYLNGFRDFPEGNMPRPLG